MRNARSFRPSFLLSHTWLSKAAEQLATTLLPQPGKKPRVSAKRHPENSCSTATLKPARFAFWEFLPQARSLFFLRAPTFEQEAYFANYSLASVPWSRTSWKSLSTSGMTISPAHRQVLAVGSRVHLFTGPIFV